MTCGVYQILHEGSGRRYIGSSVRVEARWSTHRAELNSGGHHSSYLQRAWNKYGPEAFRFEILEECGEEELAAREQHYMDLYRVCEPEAGFNLQPAARSTLGYKHTPEARAKIASARRKRCEDPAHIEELSARTRKQWRDGRGDPGPMTDARRKNISEAQKRSPLTSTKFTPEVRVKMSAAAKLRVQRMKEEGTFPSSEEMSRRTKVRWEKQGAAS